MIVRLLGAALLALQPGVASAHGDHGGARELGASGVVTIEGYQVELLGRPAPLTRGQPSRLVARVVRNSPLTPVTGGRVLIGLAPRGTVPEVRPAPEETWAGAYTLAVTPERTGVHQVRVVLAELEGRVLAPPPTVEFQVTVERPRGVGLAAWATLAALALATSAALYVAGVRARGAPDLLAVPLIRRWFTSRLFQLALQLPVLVVTALVVVLGFADVQDPALNLATRLTWTLWWAGVVFTVVLAGRLWCVACPVGASNEWTARLSGARRRMARPFRNLWWATGAFILLTWADEQLGVVRSPRVTAWLIVGLVALAVVVGLAYERRSFCRYLCPIAPVIGLYAMTAPVELRPRVPAVCREDRHQACFRGSAGSRGCPMLEFPPTLDRNTHCILCGECVKACPRDNLVLRLRAFGRDLWASHRQRVGEAYVAAVLVGLTLVLTAQMLTAWPRWISSLARWLPTGLRTTFKPVTYLSAVESGVLLVGALVAAPLLLLGAAALADRIAGSGRIGVRRTFAVFGYLLVPVALALHLAHNLGHLLLEGGGVVAAAQRAARRWVGWSLGEPDWEGQALAPEAVVAVLQTMVLVGFFALAMVAGQRLAVRVWGSSGRVELALAPLAALAFAFTAAGLVLLQQPMGLRHGM